MLFNSLHFILFLPVVVLLYYILAPRFRWILIFVASCYFYMAFVPKYILILFLIIVIDYLSALWMEKYQGRIKKAFLVFSLLSNVLLLAFFKYFHFINDNLVDLFALAGKEFHPFQLNVILPIGLSFHTFQSMSYTIEVYRGTQKAERHLGYFANYVLFFPQMVAGPIERYSTLGNELRTEHTPAYSNFSDGFRLLLFGLFIKMTVADNLAPLVNAFYENPLKHSALDACIALVCFSLQIYADFYGYSTIALGSAKLLGINIMDNFKTPYLSKSISEFWTRWHISLSTWFRDYVYISLGGNKVKMARWSLNIMIVFLVSGLWHGASWTFVCWGFLHGLFRLLEQWVNRLTGFKADNQSGLIKGILIIKTFILTTLIWVFFRAESFDKVKQVFTALCQNIHLPSLLNPGYLVTVLVAVLLISDVWLKNNRVDTVLGTLPFAIRWSVYAVLLFGLMALSGTQKFSFIYFQF